MISTLALVLALGATKHLAQGRVAPESTAIPAAGVLDGAALIAIAKEFVKSDSDRYADDPTGKYIGRDVVVSVPVIGVYDKDSHSISTALYTDHNILDLKDASSTRGAVGQNGYGARVAMTVRRGNAFGIVIPHQSGFSPIEAHYETQVAASGATAKALEGELFYRFTGKVDARSEEYSTSKKKSVVWAAISASDATTDSPTDELVRHYGVVIAYSKVELVDKRNGAVLKAW